MIQFTKINGDHKTVWRYLIFNVRKTTITHKFNSLFLQVVVLRFKYIDIFHILSITRCIFFKDFNIYHGYTTSVKYYEHQVRSRKVPDVPGYTT